MLLPIVGGVFNIGGTEEVTILDLAQRILSLVGQSSDHLLVPYSEPTSPASRTCAAASPTSPRSAAPSAGSPPSPWTQPSAKSYNMRETGNKETGTKALRYKGKRTSEAPPFVPYPNERPRSPFLPFPWKPSTRSHLDETVRRIVAALDPEAVYLYGSHAYGTPHRDSDIDLLSSSSQSPLPPHRRTIPAYRALRGLFMPAEIKVVTRAGCQRRAGWTHSVNAPPSNEAASSMPAPPDEVRAWLSKARTDFIAAERLLLEHSSSPSAPAAFHCRRLSEALKASLISAPHRLRPRAR